MDDNDANGVISNSGEGYADIAAIYRYQDSCVGHGFFLHPDRRLRPDRRRHRAATPNEDQTAGVHCATDCSGVRDADYGKHADSTPGHRRSATSARACLTGTGPCGRQVHCAAAPQRQAAWDLVARDLPRRPSASTARPRSSSATGSSTRAAATSAPGTPAPAARRPRLRRHQRLHAVDHRRRRQRQPERRHAAHDGASTPPSTATASPAPPRPRSTAAARAAQRRRGPDARPPPPATTRPRCRWNAGLRSHALLGVPHRGPRRLQLRQGQDRRRHRHQLHRHPGGQRPHLLVQRGGGGRVQRPATAGSATA